MIDFDSNFERKYSIVLADDHEVVRAGLRRLLNINKAFIIVDEANNGEDAFELVKYHKPDIAILDIMMPRMDGIEAAKLIKKTVPETLVVMLTAFEDSSHLELALEAGADGYLTKDISAKDLISSLQNVVIGERVFSKSIIHILQKTYMPSNPTDTSPVTISQREQEVLNFLALGKTSPEIAEILNISVRTVQSHRSNIIQKLGIKNASSLIRYAVINYGPNTKPNTDINI
jgi:two-component system, NarL family, response regulator NreC